MRNLFARVLKFACQLAGAWVLLALVAPLLCAVWMSFAPTEVLDPPTDEWSLRWYREFFGRAKWTRAMTTSLEVALLTVAGALTGGLGLAVAVTRFRFAGRGVLSAVVLAPLFVPGVVLALGLLPFVLALGLQGRAVTLAAAHCLVVLPVVYLLLRNALDRADPELERAARGLGAGPVTAFRRVTLPLVLPAVLAGGVIAFILSLNEFVFAVFLSSPRGRTLPAALWPEARDKETPLLAAASCVTVLVTLTGLWVTSRLLRRN